MTDSLLSLALRLLISCFLAPVFVLLRKIPRACCNACFQLPFVVSGLRRFGRLLSAACAVSVVVFHGLRRFGRCFQRLAPFRFRCCQRLAPFRSFVFSGSRRFGPLFSAACAVSVPFCFLSITLIPVAFAVVLFVYRSELPVLFSLSEDSPDLLSVFLPSCQSTSFLMLSKVVSQPTLVKFFLSFL